MVAMTPAEIAGLLNQLDTQQPLQPQDPSKLRDLLRVLALTVQAQDAQVRFLENQIAIFRDGNTATLAAGNAALNALRAVAPPTATVDQQAATQAIAKLRSDIQNATNITQTVATVASFAISLVGKFI